MTSQTAGGRAVPGLLPGRSYGWKWPTLMVFGGSEGSSSTDSKRKKAAMMTVMTVVRETLEIPQ